MVYPCGVCVGYLCINVILSSFGILVWKPLNFEGYLSILWIFIWLLFVGGSSFAFICVKKCIMTLKGENMRQVQAGYNKIEEEKKVKSK